VSNVLKTERFRILHPKGAFQIFVSEHDDGRYYGTILFHGLEGDFASGTREMKFKHQNFVGNSEEEVLAQCRNWIDRVLGAGYTISRSTGETMEKVRTPLAPAG